MCKKERNMRIQKEWKTTLYAFLYFSCLLTMLLLTGVQASAAVTYSVKFNNQNGTSNSAAFKRLTKAARKNQIIALPTVADKDGYKTVGWTTTKGGTSPIYEMGSKVRVTGDITYYLVRKKIQYCTVRFYSNSNGKLYSGLSLKVEKGKKIKLPDIPVSDLYTAKGWTKTKGSTKVTGKIGAAVKVNANLKFYGITQKKPTVTVSLYTNDGKTKYTTKTIVKGGTYKLPGLIDPFGYTMMGWATAPGQYVASSTKYYVGETLTVKKNIVLYAALFPITLEKNWDPALLPKVQKYQKVIFVGDSRTNRLGLSMEAQGVDTENVRFVAEDGKGLAWLKGTGTDLLMQEIGEGAAEGEMPVAVIFNFGINDLHNQSAYITYMKALAKTLRPLGCKLFYLSVNPDNSKMLKARGTADIREEERVRAFNTAIQRNLCTDGTYTYLDTYSYLMRTGFSYRRNSDGKDSGSDDGAHYSVNTCKVIYWYCITKLNNL